MFFITALESIIIWKKGGIIQMGRSGKSRGGGGGRSSSFRGGWSSSLVVWDLAQDRDVQVQVALVVQVVPLRAFLQGLAHLFEKAVMVEDLISSMLGIGTQLQHVATQVGVTHRAEEIH